MTTRADQIDDPMLLLARVGYRVYHIFRGEPGEQRTSIADPDMTADLDRLAELINTDDHPRDTD